jgi:hypothetical protein
MELVTFILDVYVMKAGHCFEYFMHKFLTFPFVVTQWHLKGNAKREKVAGGWRRLHNEELHNLYASPKKKKKFTVTKSRKMTLVGHVARIEKMTYAYNI